MPESCIVIAELPSKITKSQTASIEILNPSQLTLDQFLQDYLPSGGSKSEFVLKPNTVNGKKYNATIGASKLNRLSQNGIVYLNGIYSNLR